MLKRISLLLFLIIIVTGCSSSKFYLEDKYYQNGEYIEINEKEFAKMENTSYVLFIYNSYCQFSVPCQDIFKSVMEKYNISFLAMPYAEFKNTSLHNKVKYAPSVIIVKDGNIKAYLDSEKDSDIDLYQDSQKFEKWLSKYIYLEKK